MGNVWQLGPHTCASVRRATEGLCVTTRMTLPTPALPSSVTTGSATSQIEGSPIACVSPALVGNTANKVGVQGATRRPCDPLPLTCGPWGPFTPSPHTSPRQCRPLTSPGGFPVSSLEMQTLTPGPVSQKVRGNWKSSSCHQVPGQDTLH